MCELPIKWSRCPSDLGELELQDSCRRLAQGHQPRSTRAHRVVNSSDFSLEVVCRPGTVVHVSVEPCLPLVVDLSSFLGQHGLRRPTKRLGPHRLGDTQDEQAWVLGCQENLRRTIARRCGSETPSSCELAFHNCLRFLGRAFHVGAYLSHATDGFPWRGM